jgi:hypothetical protein
MLSFLVDNLVSDERAYVGCSQSPRIRFGGATGYGWIWDDGTNRANIRCVDATTGCPNTAWGVDGAKSVALDPVTIWLD